MSDRGVIFAPVVQKSIASYALPDFKGKEADLVYRMKLKDRDVIFYIKLPVIVPMVL